MRFLLIDRQIFLPQTLLESIIESFLKCIIDDASLFQEQRNGLLHIRDHLLLMSKILRKLSIVSAMKDWWFHAMKKNHQNFLILGNRNYHSIHLESVLFIATKYSKETTRGFIFWSSCFRALWYFFESQMWVWRYSYNIHVALKKVIKMMLISSYSFMLKAI